MKCKYCGLPIVALEKYNHQYQHIDDIGTWLYCSSGNLSILDKSLIAEPLDKSTNFKTLYEKLSS